VKTGAAVLITKKLEEVDTSWPDGIVSMADTDSKGVGLIVGTPAGNVIRTPGAVVEEVV